MDVEGILTQFEAAMTGQVALSGGDPAVEEAAALLQAALRPALRQLALDLAQQAAGECAAQLPGHAIDVVIRSGEPELVVRPAEAETADLTSEDFEARLTLRLPTTLKAAVEEAAGEAGDSINAHVVRLLAQRTAKLGGGNKRMTGRLDT